MYRYVCTIALIGFWVSGCGSTATATAQEPGDSAASAAASPVLGGNVRVVDGLGGSFISNREGSETGKCDMSAARESDVIKACIRAQEEPVRACYTAALDIDDTVAGQLRINLLVGLNGDVEDVKLVETTVADGELERCVMRAAGKWLFPSGREKIRFDYPFKFRSTD